MTWQHSYTPEAYDIALELLYTKPKYWLINAIMAHKSGKRNQPPFKKDLQRLHKDTLVEICFECILDTGLCSNGGFEMYIDSEGWYTIDLRDYDTKE